jgi:hypothetical protein
MFRLIEILGHQKGIQDLDGVLTFDFITATTTTFAALLNYAAFYIPLARIPRVSSSSSMTQARISQKHSIAVHFSACFFFHFRVFGI